MDRMIYERSILDKFCEDARFLRIIYKEMVDENEIKTVKQMIRKLRL